ncbi:MAG TPA: helix-turn-helix domain-containing protein [bacterium]|nr:helix-turn-helix domain-containing protein [bacterium]HNS34304.1 helix-turn-helix domain-containing protein [bacterium]HNW09530.1 helix-turn-helix domain-containing protein [bacterium]HNZ73499.1 helix-turn-helix domain-containing protein [bacterium]HOH67358.1 helix-turn-helix domain-containing protein [bacterium]
MVSFIRKKIVQSDNLGERLKEARQESGLTLTVIAQSINIAPKYLEAMEDNRLDDLPGPAYLKNFLKCYCAYLHLDFEDCWCLVDTEQCVRANSVNQRIKRRYLWSGPKFIRNLMVVVAATSILFFLGFKVKDIFVAPNLEIVEPVNGLITEARQVEIIGQAEPEVELVINNQNIFVNEAGEFTTQVDLQKGLNLIKITAKKRYSRIKEINLRILLKDSADN